MQFTNYVYKDYKDIQERKSNCVNLPTWAHLFKSQREIVKEVMG